MSRLREIKRRARGDLHREAAIPALYIPVPNATPVPCMVRVHTKFRRLGAMPATRPGQWAEHEEITPKVIFDATEVPKPRTNSIVSVEAGEAYRIAVVQPEDIGYLTAEVTQLTVAETAALPVPA